MYTKNIQMYLRRYSKFIKNNQVPNLMIDVFSKAVSSIQPNNLIKEHLKYDKIKDSLEIFGDKYDLRNRSVYIIGAGKAVVPMASEIENVLKSKIESGIISAPSGILERYPFTSECGINCYEGAYNNLPDNDAQDTALKIKELIEGLDESCFLIVLLSGGGSALLPLPISPITIKEKSQLIKQLAGASANITEINTVRKKLSVLKGGKLSILAHPVEIVSLLLSDIPGDQCEYIASGPTFEDEDKHSDAVDVIEKYRSKFSGGYCIPPSIREVLNSPPDMTPTPINMSVSNYVIGNNAMAVGVARTEALRLGYQSYHLSDAVSGDVEDISAEYCCLIKSVIQLLSKEIDEKTMKNTLNKLRFINMRSETVEELPKATLSADCKGICLIAGGEPTVQIKGTGIGGRSQQLALDLSVKYDLMVQDNPDLNDYNVYVLCAGTDGIDGPTDAAGAIGYHNLVSDARQQNINVQDHLKNNDSYNFYDKFFNGKYHIKIGHTNTNVMDIHIIIIEKKD